MSTFFVVSTPSETPKLFISQRPLEEIERSCQNWAYSHVHRSFIYELRVLPDNPSAPNGQPKGCASLALTARIEPDNAAEHYRTCLGLAIDKLPPNQALEEIQRTVDYLEKRKVDFEPTAAVVTTGP